MYSIVIRHPTLDRGVPIAYLATNDQSAEPLKQWFCVLKGLGVNPKKIMIDCDLSEANAIVAIWGESTSIQYCSWHVARAWIGQICKKLVVAEDENKEQVARSLYLKI